MVTAEVPKDKHHSIAPERIAWITMLGGLALFIFLCIGTVIFARWLVFESPTSMNVYVHVGQGTVGLRSPDSTNEQAIRGNAGVDINDRLSTDNLSQGYIAFSDPYSGEMVATVMLRNGSTATLQRASRPRFNLSANAYSIRVNNVTGSLEVWVSDGIERNVQLDIETPLGRLHIEEKGNFLITANAGTLTVTARDGNATLYGPDGTLQSVSETRAASIHQGDSAIALEPGPIDLLPYSTFDSEWPEGWICAHQPDRNFPNAPGGDYEYSSADGRPIIHLWRYDSGPTSAKTGCFQRLGQNSDGLDLKQYESVRLRVTMKVDHQSLSACGIAGSECAIMLRIEYVSQEDGVTRQWYHGFYSVYRPNEGLRICDSCWEPHEQVNPGAWYTYESVDLLSEWPKDLRPAAIKEIEFYASGHEYDVMLNEVALIATLPDATGTD